MTTARSAIAFVFALGLATLHVTDPSFAKTNAAGRYCGKAWSGGLIVDVVTELSVGVGGKLSGKYMFDDRGRTTQGTLSETQASEGRIKTLTWNDIYGTGKVLLIFDQSYGGFTGKWGQLEGEPFAPWTGGPCDTPAVMRLPDRQIQKS
ncbi:MAG TPA: hypothetical protein VIU14_15375 [Mesorhizobium sp.]